MQIDSSFWQWLIPLIISIIFNIPSFVLGIISLANSKKNAKASKEHEQKLQEFNIQITKLKEESNKIKEESNKLFKDIADSLAIIADSKKIYKENKTTNSSILLENNILNNFDSNKSTSKNFKKELNSLEKLNLVENLAKDPQNV